MIFDEDSFRILNRKTEITFMNNQKYYCPIAFKRKAYDLVLSTFLLAFIISTFGCFGERKKQAQDLVESGGNQSEKLSKYYGSLKKMRQTHLELSKFEQRRAESALRPNLIKAYDEQFAALEARANMATKLRVTYEVLGDLIDYDAPGEISTAVIDLKNAIEDVSKKKLTLPQGILSAVDPEVILQKATTALVSWIQIKQFKKNALKAEDVLGGISNLYRAEKPIYIQIAQDYYKIINIHNIYMVKNGQLNTVSRFGKYADVYGMQVNPQLPPPPQAPPPLTKINQTQEEKEEYLARMKIYENEYKKHVNYVRLLSENAEDILNEQLKDFTQNVVKEADDLDKGLVSLKKEHEDFMTGRKTGE